MLVAAVLAGLLLLLVVVLVCWRCGFFRRRRHRHDLQLHKAHYQFQLEQFSESWLLFLCNFYFKQAAFLLCFFVYFLLFFIEKNFFFAYFLCSFCDFCNFIIFIKNKIIFYVYLMIFLHFCYLKIFIFVFFLQIWLLSSTMVVLCSLLTCCNCNCFYHFLFVSLCSPLSPEPQP